MEPVKAGALTDLLRSIVNLLDKGLDKLQNIGIRYEHESKTEDGGLIYRVYVGDDIEFRVKSTPSKDDNKLINLYFKDEERKIEDSVIAVNPDDIDRYVRKFCEHYYDTDTFTREEDNGDEDKGTTDNKADAKQKNDDKGETNSSSKFQASLKRIVGSKCDKLQLVAINCGTIAPHKVMADLDAILDDEELLNSFTEEPTAIAVTDEGDEFDVEVMEGPVEVPGNTEQYIQMLQSCMDVYNINKVIFWNVHGPEFEYVRRFSDSIGWIINTQIESLAELIVEFGGSVPSWKQLLSQVETDVSVESGFSAEEAKGFIMDSVNRYISTLECYYCNMTHDVQALLDQWIREWHVRIDYELKNSI